MNVLHTSKSRSSRKHSRLLFLCLLFSLLLHVFVILIFPLLQQEEKRQPLQQRPTIVQLVDPPKKATTPQSEKPREFEIDPLPVKPPPQEPVESFRKADRNQKVEQEQAPKGDDVRDQTTQMLRPVPPTKQKQIAPNKPVQRQQQKVEQQKPQIQEELSTPGKRQETGPEIPTQPEQPEKKQLTPQQLFPDAGILSEIARGSAGDRNRVKERRDVESGDEVWLNLQNNLLVSFFRRFHDKVELVWNYPIEAATKGIEGTLQLMIIVNPQGELLDVDLIRSSGSDLLDFEAIQAIYRAAPFGPLTKHYPHDQLKIKAYFSYRLSGKIIYGRGY